MNSITSEYPASVRQRANLLILTPMKSAKPVKVNTRGLCTKLSLTTPWNAAVSIALIASLSAHEKYRTAKSKTSSGVYLRLIATIAISPYFLLYSALKFPSPIFNAALLINPPLLRSDYTILQTKKSPQERAKNNERNET